MGHIVTAGTFYADPTKTVLLVMCDKPDSAGNWYFLEIVREWGESLIWMRTWHSDQKWSGAVEAFDNCTIH